MKIYKFGSLRHRLIASYTLLCLLTCLAFSFVFSMSESYYESVLLKDRLNKEMKHYSLLIDAGVDLDVLEPKMIFPEHSLPKHLSDFTYQGFGDVEFINESGDDTELAYYKFRHNNENYILFSRLDDIEAIEDVTFLMIILVSSVILCLAVFLSIVTTNTILEPLIALTEKVTSDPNHIDPNLYKGDEVVVLAKAISSANTALRNLFVQQAAFNSDVNHELRTPLSIIYGASEILLDRLDGDPALKTVAQRINRTTLAATETVSGLLLLAQSPEKIAMELVNIRDIVKRELINHRHLMDGKDVRFDETNLHATWQRVNPELAGVAIGNLIRNACQYTDVGTILLTLDDAGLTVADTGRGVEKGMQPHMFESLVHSDQHSAAGFGIGLSIVKRIAEFLDWTVSFQSNGDIGSVFSIHFKGNRANVSPPVD